MPNKCTCNCKQIAASQCLFCLNLDSVQRCSIMCIFDSICLNSNLSFTDPFQSGRNKTKQLNFPLLSLAKDNSCEIKVFCFRNNGSRWTAAKQEVSMNFCQCNNYYQKYSVVLVFLMTNITSKMLKVIVFICYTSNFIIHKH